MSGGRGEADGPNGGSGGGRGEAAGGRTPFPGGTAGLLWAAGNLLLMLGLPLLAAGRLPDRVATHWSGASGRPDGSMPLWAAAVFPALLWAAVATAVAVVRLRARAAITWGGTVLTSMGVTLAGAQAAVVRANLDHEHWRDAEPVTLWLVGMVVAGAVGAAGATAWRRRAGAGGRPPAAPRPGATPRMDVPPGRRVVWLAGASNPWLRALGAVSGVAALAALVLTVYGVTDPLWSLVAPLAVVAVATLGCASVQVLVTEQGLRVAFGPFGWPARRWRPGDIESAHAERRTPGQVGGWGYRLSGRGTTVMLRAGDCLVVRSKGKDFAVSVDDAERGAALLNTVKGGGVGGAKGPDERGNSGGIDEADG